MKNGVAKGVASYSHDTTLDTLLWLKWSFVVLFVLWIPRLKTRQPILPYSKVQSHILGTSERAFWRTLFDTFLSKTVTHTYLEHIQNLWWLFIGCHCLFIFCGLKWGSGCWWQICSSNGITSNSTVVFLRIQPVF